MKPEVEPEVEPEVKSETKLETKPETKPETKSEIKPEVTPDVTPDRDFEKERQAQADHLAQEARQLAIASGLIQEGERFNAEQASYADSVRQNAVTEHDHIEKEWTAEKETNTRLEVEKQATREQLQESLKRVDMQLDVLLADLQSRQFNTSVFDTVSTSSTVLSGNTSEIKALFIETPIVSSDEFVIKTNVLDEHESLNKTINNVFNGNQVTNQKNKQVLGQENEDVVSQENKQVINSFDKQVSLSSDNDSDKHVTNLSDKEGITLSDGYGNKEVIILSNNRGDKDVSNQVKTFRQDQLTTQAELPNAGDTVMVKLAAVPVLGLGFILLKKKREE